MTPHIVLTARDLEGRAVRDVSGCVGGACSIVPLVRAHRLGYSVSLDTLHSVRVISQCRAFLDTTTITSLVAATRMVDLSANEAKGPVLSLVGIATPGTLITNVKEASRSIEDFARSMESTAIAELVVVGFSDEM